MEAGNQNRILYVIIGFRRLNDRASKLLELRSLYSRMVLVRPGKTYSDPENLVIRPFPNPTKAFELLRLPGARSAVDRQLWFPSAQVLYVKAALRKLTRRLEEDVRAGNDVRVLTCVPPHDVALIGLELKRRFPGIHWVIDWQDLWSYDENYLRRVPRHYRGRLFRLESEILASSDCNVTTNCRAAAVLKQRYGVASERVTAIPHHFSPEDLSGAEESKGADVKRPGVVTIGFLGTFFKPPRVPGAALYEALRRVRAQGVQVELHVHGRSPSLSRARLEQMRRNGLIFHGPTTHVESLARIAKHDFLLLLLGDLANSEAVMSIKLPHYLNVGRPVLAIVPNDSAVADIVRRTGAGHVIPADSDWAVGLHRILDEFLDNDAALVPTPRNEQEVARYSWENVSKEWMTVLFDGATEQPAETRAAEGAVPTARVEQALPSRTRSTERPTPESG